MTQQAFLFPGQGSQAIGMLAALAQDFPVVRETFAAASDALGEDLWKICQDGPESRLNATEVTQPAMLAADIATWRAWKTAGGADPQWLAGHSLGEYAALVAADSLRFEDAIRLVRLRGQFMQEAVPQGTGSMAALLGLEDAAVESACLAAAAGEVVSCANYNSPGQVVIAGTRGAVERACAAAKAAGAKRAIVLPVSVPSHCALMLEAAGRLAAELGQLTINAPRLPVLHNVDAQVRENVTALREALVLQVWQPVQWTRTVANLASAGVGRFVECGPGKVLAGLNRRIAPAAEIVALTDPESMAGLIGGQAG